MINCPKCGGLELHLAPYGICERCIVGLMNHATVKSGKIPHMVMTTSGPMQCGWIYREVERVPLRQEVAEAMGSAGA